MHLSQLHCGELLTAVIQYWQWKSTRGQDKRGKESAVCFSGVIVLSSAPPTSCAFLTPTAPPSFFIIWVKIIVSPPTLFVSMQFSISLHLPTDFFYSSLLTIIILFITPVSLYLFLCFSFFLPFCSSSALSSPLPFLYLPLFSSSLPHSPCSPCIPAFATIISVLVLLRLSLSVIMFLSHCLTIIISMSYCLSPGVIISISCVSSLIPLVLGCFYSTHSPAIFIPQKNKYHNLSLSVFFFISISRTHHQPTVELLKHGQLQLNFRAFRSSTGVNAALWSKISASTTLKCFEFSRKKLLQTHIYTN